MNEYAPISTIETNNMTCQQLPKRKRWERSSTSYTLDKDDPNQRPWTLGSAGMTDRQRPIKQHQCETDDQPEALWILSVKALETQLEPQPGRRT
jgi:hypothetical protein